MLLKDGASYLVHGNVDVSEITDRFNQIDLDLWNNDKHRQAIGQGPHKHTNSIILNYCRGEPEFNEEVYEINKSLPGYEEYGRNIGVKGFRLPWDHRSYNDFLTDIKNMEYRFVDEKLNAVTDRIVSQLEQQLNGKAGLVLFVKLPAQTNISPHQDKTYYLEIVHRLHIPIITNDQVEFFFQKEPHGACVTVNMKPGTVYEINNQFIHSVKNSGSTDRIHLIVDIIPQDKLPS